MGTDMASNIDNYKPLTAPSPAVWLEIDEQQRLALVQQFHSQEQPELDETASMRLQLAQIANNALAL